MATDSRELRALSVWSNPVLLVAAVLVVASLAIGIWRFMKVPALGPPVVYVTTVGDRETIGIGDGTSVVLGPTSRLTVSPTYGKSTRDVTLQGEALFTVQHDPSKRPFRVLTDNAVAEDVGSTFAVRAYSPTDTVRVVVTDGVVMLQRSRTTSFNADTTGTIRAGQVGLIGRDGPALVSSVSNADDLIAWSTGQLVFDGTPMSRVAEELKRWYDVQVVVDSTLTSRRVTAGFSGDSIAEVARVIANAIGARAERQGRTLVFRPK